MGQCVDVGWLDSRRGLHILGSSLDGSEQSVIGEVAVALRGLVTGVAQYLPDGEQIDAGVDHEGRRRVSEVVDSQAR